MTSLFFIIIFQHFLTVVHSCATRKLTRPMNVPWYWTSVINIKYFLFVPASSFPNNPQAGFRSQNIPGTILNKQFACHLLVLEIKRVYQHRHMPFCASWPQCSDMFPGVFNLLAQVKNLKALYCNNLLQYRQLVGLFFLSLFFLLLVV